MKKPPAPLRAVFFDAGNTLLRVHPSVGILYARVAAAHGVSVDPDWVERRFRREFRRRNTIDHVKSDRREKAWWAEVVQAVFDGHFPPRAFRRYFDELFDLFARPRAWRLYPDALPTLRALRRRGLTLGIVSNWDTRLFKLCDGLGLTKKVDFILPSAAVGSAKPERGIFRLALQRARVRPEEALHVGDTYRDDYVGARRAGLRALWLCRHEDGSGKTPRVGSLFEARARISEQLRKM